MNLLNVMAQQHVVLGYFIHYGIPLLIAILSITARHSFAQFIIKYMKRLIPEGPNLIVHRIIDGLYMSLSFIFIVFGLWVTTLYLDLPSSIDLFFRQAVSSFMLLALFWGLYNVAEPVSLLVDDNKSLFGSRTASELRAFIIKPFKFVVFSVGTLTLMQSWGFNVGAFLAGLGIVGAAIGFASQDTIKCFFGFFSIFLDHLFKTGESIKIGDIRGKVENVGLRTTHIRQLDNTLVLVPNSNFVSSILVNFSRIDHRYLTWEFSIELASTAEQLKTLTESLRNYLKSHPDVEYKKFMESTIVRVDRFTNESAIISVSFYTKTSKYDESLRIKEEILLNMKNMIHEYEIKFTTPVYNLVGQKEQ